MKIYFLRHGEYVRSSDQQHPDKTTPLSENGVNMIKEKSQLITTFNIEKIYASELERAKQSAEIISEHLQKPIIVDANLNERLRGKESFDELILRGENFLKTISNEPCNLLVVSHSEILATIFGLLIFGNDFTENLHNRTKHFFYLHVAELLCIERRKIGWKVSECSSLNCN